MFCSAMIFGFRKKKKARVMWNSARLRMRVKAETMAIAAEEEE